jgi:hypothetical protein
MDDLYITLSFFHKHGLKDHVCEKRKYITINIKFNIHLLT